MSVFALSPLSRRELALRLWEREIGQPYVWGGDDPVLGWDCSGLMIEGLKAAGILPREGDWTAEGLAARFRERAVEQPRLGCLLFWKRGERIGHVEVVWTVIRGALFTIGASGGGSSTQTREDAVRQNAYVKVRPAAPGWVLAVDPFQGEGGLA